MVRGDGGHAMRSIKTPRGPVSTGAAQRVSTYCAVEVSKHDPSLSPIDKRRRRNPGIQRSVAIVLFGRRSGVQSPEHSKKVRAVGASWAQVVNFAVAHHPILLRRNPRIFPGLLRSERFFGAACKRRRIMRGRVFWLGFLCGHAASVLETWGLKVLAIEVAGAALLPTYN